MSRASLLPRTQQTQVLKIHVCHKTLATNSTQHCRRKNKYKVFNWDTGTGAADDESSDDDDSVEIKKKFGLSGVRSRRQLSGAGKQVIGAQIRNA